MPSVYGPTAAKVAAQYGIPKGIFLSLVDHESSFNPNARSSAGAYGLTQLMPATAKELGVNLQDPHSQLDGGARYLKQQYDRFGNWKQALAAYNAGPGTVESGVWQNFPETKAYVNGVLGDAQTKFGGLVGAPGEVAPKSARLAPSQPTLDTRAFALASLQHLGDPGFALGQLAKGAYMTQPVQATPQVQVKGVTPTSKRDTGAVALIQKYLGTPYVWGGTKPGGFDCSGLLQYVWGREGVSIPRTSYEQWGAGVPVGKGKLQPGDAVFFKGSDSQNGLPGHVGMYIGGGKFVEAPHTGSVVRISTLAGRTDFMGGRRFT